MKRETHTLGKILYALLFLVIIPFLLWYWAELTEHLVRFPAVESEICGWILLIAGGILLVWGMLAIVKYGKGLPMNLQPPPNLVRKGPYKIVKNPIYWGFGILVTGFFILIKSASGLWLVTPVTLMAMTALVLGYENIDLQQRFPNEQRKTVFDLPENSYDKPVPASRVIALLKVYGLLFIGNFITVHLVGDHEPAIQYQVQWPHLFNNTYLLILSNFVILIMPFLLHSKQLIREWIIGGSVSISISVLIALIYPTVGAQYLPSNTLSSTWVDIFTLGTIPVFLLLFSLQLIWQQSKKLSYVFLPFVLVLVVIQISLSKSFILSLTTSVIIYLVASNYFIIWNFARIVSEKIANSWHEWVFGKIRIINHGFYVGFAALSGLFFAGYLVGPVYAWAILIFAMVVLLVAALWAQIIEGSEKLKRPFGFYGGLVGMIFSSITVGPMGYEIWTLVGVITIFLPWAQAIGRLRCLVNGCCHGSQIDDPFIGIRYFHYRSRVCGISGLKGELLHPTQLYSILWLFLNGFVLFALWNSQSPPSFILGLYLILNGIGRFVEEAFRGEVQTKIVKGLRLYQWTAILSVIVGIAFTIVPTEPILMKPDFGWEIVIAALIGGFCTFFAMGVDFPQSNARFSRLV